MYEVLTEMEIQTYQDLEQKGILLPLMEQAFGWPFDPIEFEKTVKADPRLRESCVGFCALKEGKALGYVGVMDLTLRASNGAVEKVGGLYGVATLPGYTRQGICTALLNRAHEHFRAKNYRFSLLTTSPTIVAHSLYEKMGYFDVTSFPSAYKIRQKDERHEISEREGVSKWNLARMLELFHEYVKNKTGFVVRDEAYMKMLMKQYEISAKECIMTQRGYVIFKKEKKQARVRELVAQNNKEMDRLIRLVENKAQRIVIGRLGAWDPALDRAYKSRGFIVLETGHGVLMVKQLLAKATFNVFCGKRFYMSALDHF
jgi:ribosomal protein S18 acetylase RimI-like enzyme